jgi:hypothetical protein
VKEETAISSLEVGHDAPFKGLGCFGDEGRKSHDFDVRELRLINNLVTGLSVEGQQDLPLQFSQALVPLFQPVL